MFYTHWMAAPGYWALYEILGNPIEATERTFFRPSQGHWHLRLCRCCRLTVACWVLACDVCDHALTQLGSHLPIRFALDALSIPCAQRRQVEETQVGAGLNGVGRCPVGFDDLRKHRVEADFQRQRHPPDEQGGREQIAGQAGGT